MAALVEGLPVPVAIPLWQFEQFIPFWPMCSECRPVLCAGMLWQEVQVTAPPVQSGTAVGLPSREVPVAVGRRAAQRGRVEYRVHVAGPGDAPERDRNGQAVHVGHVGGKRVGVAVRAGERSCHPAGGRGVHVLLVGAHHGVGRVPSAPADPPAAKPSGGGRFLPRSRCESPCHGRTCSSSASSRIPRWCGSRCRSSRPRPRPRRSRCGSSCSSGAPAGWPSSRAGWRRPSPPGGCPSTRPGRSCASRRRR